MKGTVGVSSIGVNLVLASTICAVLLCASLPAAAVVRGVEGAAPDSSRGAGKKDGIRTLPEIVVKATPIVDDTEVDRYAMRTAVITSRAVRDLNAQDLESALRRVPGVDISRYNLVGSYGGGDGGAIYLRGLGSGRPGSEISVLFDGIPRYAGVWTHPLLDEISLDAASRIEVERSPQPVLVGNMAFGVVNLVPERRLASGFLTRLTAGAGSHDTRTAVLEQGGRRGGLDYFLSAGRRQSDGHRPHSAGTVRSLFGRAGYSFSPQWELTVEATHTDGSVQDPGVEGAAPIPIVPTYGSDAALYIAALPHRVGPVAGTLKVYYELGHTDWLQWQPPSPFPPPGRAGEAFSTLTAYKNYGLRWRETVASGAADWTLGFDQDVTSGQAEERHADIVPLGGRRRLADSAPYVLVSRSFGGGPHGSGVTVTPSAGARYNHSRDFGDDWGWQAGITASGGRFTFYANHAHAFNLPGLYAAAMYSQFGRDDEWRSLRAERCDHYEFGGVYPRLGPLTLSLAAYHDEVKDALRFIPPPPGPPSFANIGRFVSRGLEASVSWAPGAELALFSGVSLMSTTPTSVPNAPAWNWIGGATWLPLARVKVSADADWIARQYVLNPRFAVPSDWSDTAVSRVGAHFLLNGRLAYDLARSGLPAGAEIFVAGENLTDARYSYRSGYPMPGITWSGGVILSR